ncbi:hypothetical protein DPMN_179120 [Dreissena polymorpha]|uniref:Bcl-2 Bcl-2 homology region 1-3 domain-containing protein n=1 Tax=Dreissena polymorpha TaxID=45954 RepID=A0A9D4EC77_DREPO|nr:hypothetical protein DPMN_179120 [Dreissena polymorpha]
MNAYLQKGLLELQNNKYSKAIFDVVNTVPVCKTVFVLIANEMLPDLNWERILSLYTFQQQMVKKSYYDPEFSEFTEIWLKQNVTPWVEANGGWEGLNTFLKGRMSIGEYLRESLTFLWNWNK